MFVVPVDPVEPDPVDPVVVPVRLEPELILVLPVPFVPVVPEFMLLLELPVVLLLPLVLPVIPDPFDPDPLVLVLPV